MLYAKIRIIEYRFSSIIFQHPRLAVRSLITTQAMTIIPSMQSAVFLLLQNHPASHAGHAEMGV
jgi:hypothetical protein